MTNLRLNIYMSYAGIHMYRNPKHEQAIVSNAGEEPTGPRCGLESIYLPILSSSTTQ